MVRTCNKKYLFVGQNDQGVEVIFYSVFLLQIFTGTSTDFSNQTEKSI